MHERRDFFLRRLRFRLVCSLPALRGDEIPSSVAGQRGDDVINPLGPTQPLRLGLGIRPEIPRRHPGLRMPVGKGNLLQMSMVARDDHDRLLLIDGGQERLDERLDRRKDRTGTLDLSGVAHKVS